MRNGQEHGWRGREKGRLGEESQLMYRGRGGEAMESKKSSGGMAHGRSNERGDLN